MVHACKQEKRPDPENEPALASVSTSGAGLSYTYDSTCYDLCKSNSMKSALTFVSVRVFLPSSDIGAR